jgi:NADPH-dependent 2,4-dienoyl-CoA reductase/sulfur reductase-like enzyme
MSVQHSKYLIAGGGLTADSACKGIRDVDADGAITVVGDEAHPPYLRPPLSKALWKGKDEKTIWRGTEKYHADLRLGRRIVAVDLAQRTARDDQGDEYRYEKLLFATGGRPRRFAFGGDDVVYFRTLDDYRKLRVAADRHVRFCVIGGGFIGSEIAAALAMNGCAVSLVFPGEAIGARIFPKALSSALNAYYREHGVELLPKSSVTGIERQGSGFQVTLGDARAIDADIVVAGIGILPNAELAANAGLAVENGIVVDEYGRAGGREDVFAAGDVARFPVAALGTEMRFEHEDQAKSQGRRVGKNMAGQLEAYDRLPFFYSDLFDAGYEAVGETDARLGTLLDWDGSVQGKGTVTYLDSQRRPRGMLLWNRFGHVDEARELIRAAKPLEQGTHVG